MPMWFVRHVSTKNGLKVTEALLQHKLKKGLPRASDIKIQDISGGCGAMFEVYVESADFEGLSRVKQHQLVNRILAEEVKAMHGIRISTASPQEKKPGEM